MTRSCKHNTDQALTNQFSALSYNDDWATIAKDMIHIHVSIASIDFGMRRVQSSGADLISSCLLIGHQCTI